TCKAIVSTLIILVTTASCSRPDMPQPRIGIFQREPSFSGRVTDAANPQLAQRDDGQSRVRPRQPRTAISPKVATVRAPKATSQSVQRPAAKKASTPAQLDEKREQQLFQEFLEWRKRQTVQP